jgi:Rps23 Pro-64 3,4-dihydroxylase Tpa1-like proline 4-hydroxylase
MLAYISAITGVKDLHSDPMRFGGGQHVTTYGGRLGIHADFTHHPQSGMRRALNLLLYLNYAPSGVLELWSADMKERRTYVHPTFNRAIIFKTSTTSFHGHPEPFMGKERLSLAAYYYVQETWDGTGHTNWIRDGYLKTTDYRLRPWEYGLRVRRWLSKMVKG